MNGRKAKKLRAEARVKTTHVPHYNGHFRNGLFIEDPTRKHAPGTFRRIYQDSKP